MDRVLFDDLKDILGERISFSESVRNNYAKGEDAYDPILPKAVLFPNDNDELSKILKICNKLKRTSSKPTLTYKNLVEKKHLANLLSLN